MKAIFLIASFALSLCSIAVKAQQYASIDLGEIGELLGRHNVQHVVEKDRTGVVTHLGLPLLPHSDDVNLNMLFRFVERYALHVQLLPTAAARRMMADDKVEMDVAKVAAIDSTQNIDIDCSEQICRLAWNGGEMKFPNSFSLISGLNKAESDKAFHDGLMRYADKHVITDSHAKPRNAAPSDSSHYHVEKGNSYIIQEINTDKFYVRLSGDSLCPIYSSLFPSETLANLMQEVTNGDFNLRISQNMYGYQRQQYDIPLRHFTMFCLDTGCIPFVGIEEENDKEVKAVVVYKNKLFAYNHLLYITMDVETMRKGGGCIDATLYCYIPTHNIKSLYDEK